jgi:hypothetical protein
MPEVSRAAVSARGWLALAGLGFAIAALRGLGLLHDHSLNSIDGALQTWFALDHFARGEQLGAAFQSYLGITMVLALLPVFVVFGQTLFASTLAANVAVVGGAFGTAYAIVWMMRAVPKARRWQATVLLIFAFYYAGRIAAETVGLAWPATFDPGVSLRPLRGALPFLVLPFFVLFVRRALRGCGGVVAGLSLGLVAGAGLLWSNDAGIPLVLALVLGLVMSLHRHVGLLARMLASFGAGLAISASAILLAVTHGAPGPWLQYNFRDIAGDQFWFFAPWERSTRILGVSDLPNILRHADPLSAASLIVLILCVLWAMLQRLRGRSAPVRGSAFVFVGASVIGTALIPQIGGHVGAEYNAITFVLGACAPLIVAPAGVWRRAGGLLRSIRPAHITTLTAVAALAMIGTEGARLAVSPARGERTAYDPALGFFVTPEYAQDLTAMRQLADAWDARGVPQNRRLLSVYTSPLDIAAGVRSPADVGSLIHALGPEKRAAFTALVAERKVAAVTTIAPDYSGWEGWIRRANWPFFRALHANYTPIARNDQQVLWVRAEGERAASSPATCRVAARAPARLVLEVTAPTTGLATVTVTRQPPFATGRGAMLTVTEASPDTAESADRWADFPRYGIANTARLALMAPVAPGEPTRLMLDVLDGSAIGAATCTAVVDAAPDLANLPPLPEGIARHLAGGAS